VGGGGGGVGQRVVEELEAGGAKGGWVEEEDAGGADAAVHAANPEAVEETAVLGGTVTAFGIDGGVWRRRNGFSRRKVHDNGDWFGNECFRVLVGMRWERMRMRKDVELISFHLIFLFP